MAIDPGGHAPRSKKNQKKQPRNGDSLQHNGSSVVALPHGRVPPHNIDAERSLLGGIFLGGSAAFLSLGNRCSAKDFFREQHRLVFEAMAALSEDGQPIDRVTVKDFLDHDGRYEEAGGDDYIDLLDKFVPTAANLEYYAKIIHEKAVARRLIEEAGAIAQLGYEQHGELSDFLAESQKRIKDVLADAQPKRNRFAAAHTKFSVQELTTDPEPLKFLLWPYIQMETVNVLSGGGGSGKTAFLMALAAARALGRPLFSDLYLREGETAILTTEDRKIHYRHKLHAIREQIGTDFDPKLVSDRIHLLDMAGLPVRLIASDRGEQFLPTAEVDDLAEALKLKAPKADWIIIETISRVTGGIESNPAMTVLVNACERLCILTGAAVTLVGHVGQNTARAGLADAYAARGGSALGDNARSSIVLVQLTDKNKKQYVGDVEISSDDLARTLVWAHPKSNGAAPAKPRLLRKESTKFGMVLTGADFSDAPLKQQEKPSRKKGTAMKFHELKAAIVEEVEKAKKPVSRNEVLETIGGKASSFFRAVKDLIADRLIDVDLTDKLIPGTTGNHQGNHHPESGGSRPPLPPTVLPSGGSEGGGENQLPLIPGSAGTGEPGGTGKRREPPSLISQPGISNIEEPPPHDDQDAPDHGGKIE